MFTQESMQAQNIAEENSSYNIYHLDIIQKMNEQ